MMLAPNLLIHSNKHHRIHISIWFDAVAQFNRDKTLVISVDTTSGAKDNASKRLIFKREFNAKQGNFIMRKNVSGGLTVSELKNIAFRLTSEKDRTSFDITNDWGTNSKHCLLEVTALETNRSPTAKTGKWCFVAKDVDDSPDKIFAFKPVLDDMELHLQLCILPREKTFLHLNPAGGSVVASANTVKKVTAAIFAKQNLLIMQSKPLELCFRSIVFPSSDKNANRSLVDKTIQQAGGYLAADAGFLANPSALDATKK